MSVAVKTKEDTTSVMREPTFLLNTGGPVCQRILMRQYAYSPRKDMNKYEVRGKDNMGKWMAGAVHPIWPTHWSCHSPKEISDWGPIVA